MERCDSGRKWFVRSGKRTSLLNDPGTFVNGPEAGACSQLPPRFGFERAHVFCSTGPIMEGHGAHARKAHSKNIALFLRVSAYRMNSFSLLPLSVPCSDMQWSRRQGSCRRLGESRPYLKSGSQGSALEMELPDIVHFFPPSAGGCGDFVNRVRGIATKGQEVPSKILIDLRRFSVHISPGCLDTGGTRMIEFVQVSGQQGVPLEKAIP